MRISSGLISYVCHPGLDPRSRYPIRPMTRFEELSLDSRFCGNDKLFQNVCQLSTRTWSGIQFSVKLRGQDLKNFLWIPAVAGMTNCLKKFVSCHPGLDPGSRYPIRPMTRFEELSLDSRFRGNDKKQCLSASVPQFLNASMPQCLCAFVYWFSV